MATKLTQIKLKPRLKNNKLIFMINGIKKYNKLSDVPSIASDLTRLGFNRFMNRKSTIINKSKLSDTYY